MGRERASFSMVIVHHSAVHLLRAPVTCVKERNTYRPLKSRRPHVAKAYPLAPRAEVSELPPKRGFPPNASRQKCRRLACGRVTHFSLD